MRGVGNSHQAGQAPRVLEESPEASTKWPRYKWPGWNAVEMEDGATNFRSEASQSSNVPAITEKLRQKVDNYEGGAARPGERRLIIR